MKHHPETETQIEIDPTRKMSRPEAELHQKAILAGIGDIGMRLLKIREEKGWAALGYASFKEYGEYLDEQISLRHMYRLVDVAEVNRSLTERLDRVISLPVTHALTLKNLDPDERVQAFNEAIKGWQPGGPKPSVKEFQKAVAKVNPAATKPPVSVTRSAKSDAKPKPAQTTGWTPAVLEADEELANHMLLLEEVYGKADTEAIKHGTLPLTRGDVIYLARLPKERALQIKDLLFETHWSPLDCIKFINTEPDDNSTVEDLKHLCLATKGKYWTGDFAGFLVSINLNKGPTR